MHKTLLLLGLLIFINFNLSSQITGLNTPSLLDNVRFGGGFNVGFGNSYSTFSISPTALYDFSNEFSAGLSFTYVYVKNKSNEQSTTNMLGGSLLAFYKPFYNLQFSSEYENLNINSKYAFKNKTNRWQPALYFGAEYVTGNFAMGLRYDVLFNEEENLIYSSALNPVFRYYF
ncbi:alpha-ketoglutarate decarboxylase [Lutibacter citreus]|uniref:alpha-ketoglutarate decarboxylase n=1 Tax=Lutibacter citreus TaxID=2138210 RepID=UPI001300444D|nr:alpha-ketoglutarate decarboxylase [Lutibacter citreus]